MHNSDPDQSGKPASDFDIIGSVMKKAEATRHAPPVRNDVNAVGEPPWELWGFDGKARIKTDFGYLPIEALRPRDAVLTPSGAYKRIVWVDVLKLEPEFLASRKTARPMLVGKGAIEPDVPMTSLLLSPGQKVCTTRVFSMSGLAPLNKLTGRPNIFAQPTESFKYYLFSYGEAGAVNVEGLWCQTYPAAELPRDVTSIDD